MVDAGGLATYGIDYYQLGYMAQANRLWISLQKEQILRKCQSATWMLPNAL